MLRGRTRVLNACQRCRKQKIKCSGTPPCRICRARGLDCDFGAEEKQVLITERELFELKSRISWLQRQQTQNGGVSTTQTDTAPLQPQSLPVPHVPSSEPEASHEGSDAGQGEVPNPLAPGQPAYVTESSGRLRYLGHSSTYAFTQQVFNLTRQTLPSNPSPEILSSFDDVAYKSESHRLTPVQDPDIARLPSKDIALHHLQTVKFRTQPIYYLFDEQDFTACLQDFYRGPFDYAKSNPIWFAHYLVLMAFGKAIDSGGQGDATTPPMVSELFVRALTLLPDMTELCEYPVKSTELCCSIALYLQSIHHKQAATVYIGQAIRIGQLYALHTDLQESVVGQHLVQKGRRIWWTVYSLNQKITSSIGLPNFIRDADMTTPRPTMWKDNEDDTALALHVKICHLLGYMISRVYDSSKVSFLSTTRTVLKGAAAVADELKQFTKDRFGEISRVAAHLELAYHQCIIFACRPALFHVLKERISNPLALQVIPISSSMTGLIQVCVDSAVQAVQILSQLQTHNLLDMFLPFDLECGFSAALVLVMAQHTHPKIVPQNGNVQSALGVLGAIASRGNMHANLRKLEVEQLTEILTHPAPAFQSSGITAYDHNEPTNAAYLLDTETLPIFEAPFFDQWNFDYGISGNQIMDLVNALDSGEFNSTD